MTGQHDRTAPDYLWDPTARPDLRILELERALASWRFDPGGSPLALAGKRPRSARRVWGFRALLAAAATALILLGAAAYRWTWPAGHPWPMTVSTPGASRRAELAVGSELRLTSTQMARIRMARIGLMDVRGGSEVTLRSTGSNRHRLALTAGWLDVRVWAPPRSVVIQTPAGDVVDLGCAFRLGVDHGIATVHVESGWVQMENAHGEVLVPAGASSYMMAGHAPGAPIFEDARPAFRTAVRDLERDGTWRTPGGSLEFLEAARVRDVFTLLMLADAVPPDLRRPLVERAALLEPPPPGVSPESIVRGASEPLWRWVDALELPPPKSWWRNWRDAPFWAP
ncbi:MAG: hypothetical protein PVF68_06305 [Acidobacteriota bacterium]